MLHSPFSLLKPFENRLSVAFFTKANAIESDDDAAAELGVRKAVGLEQKHGNRTVVIRTPSPRTKEADGMITDTPDLALCLRVADCQSFLIYEPEKNVVGLLHVGWRGLIAAAIPEFFRVMKAEWGIDGRETFVATGPSLCLHCSDFSDPATELPSLPKEFVHGKTVDLRGAADAELFSCGVRPERFERLPDCTRCHPEKYWTYRGGDHEQVRTGHCNMLVCALRSV